MKSNYKKLGEYIREINIRNSDLRLSTLLGVSVSKEFIPSIANTVGTDFSKYKIVRKNQFTYIPDTSRRGDKIGIALLQNYEEALVSQAYTVFEVVDKNRLNPEYLMMWFRRSEFDRYARFKSEGSVREIFSWKELCNVELPIPSIESQRKIVEQYNQINQAIKIKEAINNNLEQQIFTIFSNDFPEVYLGDLKIGDYISPKRGKSLLSKDAVNGKIPVVAGGKNCSTYHNVANTKSPVITISASGANAGYVNLWHTPVWSSDSSFIDEDITPNVYFWYVLLKKRQKEIYDIQTGSAQPHIYPQHIEILPIIKLNEEKVINFNQKVMPIFNTIGSNIKAINNLIELKLTLLPKLMLENSYSPSDKLSFI